MKHLSKTVRTIGVVAAVAIFTAGCAAKKPPAGEKSMGPATAAAASDSHTVVTGEHLWGIAGTSAVYGDPFHWPRLYRANAGQIKDADLIFAGQVLEVSRSDSAEMIASAVRHAKTRGPWQIGVTEASDTAWLASGP